MKIFENGRFFASVHIISDLETRIFPVFMIIL